MTNPLPPSAGPLSQPASSFIWGSGGRRLTPDDIIQKRRLASQHIAAGADYSPIQHWAQGLARVANGLAGGIQMRQADRAADEARTAEEDIIANLMNDYDPASGGVDPVAAALANPGTRDLGVMAWQARHPKPESAPDIIQLARIANDPTRPAYERETAAAAVSAKNDPIVTFSTPNGIFYGPVSQVPTAFGGGSPQPSQPPPDIPQEAIDMLLSQGNDAQFDEVFGVGAAARVRGGPGGSPSGAGFRP